MITLGEAIKITKISEDEIVWLCPKGKERSVVETDSKPYTLSSMRKKLDFKRVMVHRIKPSFDWDGKYFGLEFIVTGPKVDELMRW